MNNKLFKKLSHIFTAPKLTWVIIGIGIALRIVRYLHNTSLWFDESVYAVDIINRSITDFIHQSNDFLQVQAFGFYIFEKFAVNMFGNSEYALRLLPLLFGIASLFLFHKVAKDILNSNAVPVALALFAILDPLIYYSTELKPYSGDVFFALLILSLASYEGKKLNVRHIVMCTVVGAIAILSSTPSVFVLGGVWAGLLLSCLQRREWAKFRGLLIVSIIWALIFLTIYFTYTRIMIVAMTKYVSLETAFEMEKFIMPFPPRSLLDIKWFIDFFFDTFLFQDSIMYVKRVTLSGLMAFAFLAGSVAMIFEKRDKFYILFFPIILTLLAAAMHQYPFKGRQILFLVPMFLLIISEGAEYVRDKISKNSLLMGAVFIGLLFIYPVSWAAYHVKRPLVRSEIKPVLSYIKHNWQEGDVVYVHFFAQYEFEYYTKYHPAPYKFDENEYVIGIAPRGWYDKWRKNKLPERYRNIYDQSRDELLKEYIRDLNMVEGNKRVWVVFTGDITMENFFLSHMDTIGEKKDTFGHSGLALTVLYDLSK